MATEYQRRPITAVEFNRMFELGIFKPDERVELIEGEIIVMHPMKLPQISSVARLNRILIMRLGEQAVVMPQLPVWLSKITQPQPDFAILHPRDDFYATARPSAKNSYALIECSDTSLSFDRGTKLRSYAKNGVLEYWIVNLRGRQLEIKRSPHDLGYADEVVAKPGESIALQAFPDLPFTVDELLGPQVDWPDEPDEPGEIDDGESERN